VVHIFFMHVGGVLVFRLALKSFELSLLSMGHLIKLN
jgi:hypothetical protein